TIADDVPERVQFALDLLYHAAGETAPTEYYTGRKDAEKVAAAWQKWHEKHQASLDLSNVLARVDLGYTLITTNAIGVKGKNKIFELGAKPQNAVRWEFEGPRSPLDVQIIGPNRVLIAEYADGRVTERDFKGTILHQFQAKLKSRSVT